ncbi:uncharacterized protein (DUF2236 family) [Herbihabitans rhizosphaerae]|uniref:Uncharacterized protein (DUF2236 family) n=1 Tax=Herbihabitans rhizosphaerae TaxID=1872711 RepID=A0A4Q7KGE2_9PSEU|nr:oxygenase MpaB family protein [Herbihabitans rhizosphaerae]RZS32636.1 uncharacterized protein (DUF2236 family) [Herbihabitans rhizosphaerae]
MTHVIDTLHPLGPGSVSWRISGDRRAVLGGGAALLLQVGHPTIGAGVQQHSNFIEEPWDRLDRTLQSLWRLIFGGERAVEESRRLRELHKTIKGVDHHGQRYHALNPEAYWWVHATLFDVLLRLEEFLGNPLSPSDQVRLYDEWRQLGRLLGIPERLMPNTLDGFQSYVDDMIATTLERNETAALVLASLRLQGVSKPPVWYVPGWAWRAAKPFGRKVGHLTTAGLLPPAARPIFGLDWTDEDAVRFRRLGVAVGKAGKLIPPRVRLYKAAYVARRAAGLL